MKFLETPIADTILIEPKVFGDSRGFFMEAWHAGKFREVGIDPTFMQDNQSRSGTRNDDPLAFDRLAPGWCNRSQTSKPARMANADTMN